MATRTAATRATSHKISVDRRIVFATAAECSEFIRESQHKIACESVVLAVGDSLGRLHTPDALALLQQVITFERHSSILVAQKHI